MLSDIWVTVSVREDGLSPFKMDAVLKGKVPSIADQVVEFQVFQVRAMEDFATWKAAKPTGQYDMKTFEVKLRPVKAVKDLRPGASILFDIK